MTKQELEQKIKELEKQIAELKNAKVEDKVWKPEFGTRYYYISLGLTNYSTWDNSTIDIFRYEQGNCFKTEEEAEEHLKKLTIQGKFKTFVREHSNELDWGNNHQQKYFIYFNSDKHLVQCMDTIMFKEQGVIYASSEQILKDAIEYIGGEEVAKKYLFD